MFKAFFAKPQRIADEQRLRALFGTTRLCLDHSASLTCEGEICLGPDVSFFGDCRLEHGNSVDQGSILTNVQLGEGNRVRPYSILSDIKAGTGNLFGPFCFIRDDCLIGDRCILGAHVEATRSRFGSGVKISHRAFVGDAEVGEATIIGAGVVFCNFDGTGRQPTRIGARVTLGSGVLLIPPLTIGNDVMVGAGSTINRDIADGAKIIQKRVDAATARALEVRD